MVFRIARALRHIPARATTAALILLVLAWATGQGQRFHQATLK